MQWKRTVAISLLTGMEMEFFELVPVEERFSVRQRVLRRMVYGYRDESRADPALFARQPLEQMPRLRNASVGPDGR